jgi:hypothetical protein
MTTIPPVPPQFEVTAALNRALFLDAAVKTLAANLSAEEEKLKVAMAELEKLMLANNMVGVTSTLGSADIVPKLVYNATDWNALHAHIQKTGEFDLLQRRLTQTAMRDRDSNNDLPPGVRRVNLPTLKLSIA